MGYGSGLCWFAFSSLELLTGQTQQHCIASASLSILMCKVGRWVWVCTSLIGFLLALDTVCVKCPAHRNNFKKGSYGCHTEELCPNSGFVSTLPFIVLSSLCVQWMLKTPSAANRAKAKLSHLAKSSWTWLTSPLPCWATMWQCGKSTGLGVKRLQVSAVPLTSTVTQANSLYFPTGKKGPFRGSSHWIYNFLGIHYYYCYCATNEETLQSTIPLAADPRMPPFFWSICPQEALCVM